MRATKRDPRIIWGLTTIPSFSVISFKGPAIRNDEGILALHIKTEQQIVHLLLLLPWLSYYFSFKKNNGENT